MPQEPNNDYDNLFEVLNSFTTLIEVESEAVRDIVPGATGAALTAQVAKIANLSFDIAAIAYAYKTLPRESSALPSSMLQQTFSSHSLSSKRSVGEQRHWVLLSATC